MESILVSGKLTHGVPPSHSRSIGQRYQDKECNINPHPRYDGLRFKGLLISNHQDELFCFGGKENFKTSLDSISWVNTMYMYIYLFNFYNAYYVPGTILTHSKINIRASNNKHHCCPFPFMHFIDEETSKKRLSNLLETKR